jgi:hypothetical protein
VESSFAGECVGYRVRRVVISPRVFGEGIVVTINTRSKNGRVHCVAIVVMWRIISVSQEVDSDVCPISPQVL